MGKTKIRNDEKDIHNLKLFIRIMIIFLIINIVIFGINHNSECSGIGGFVYKEIEWTEQTYNIINENCGKLDGMNIPILFYDDSKKQFYCYTKYDCNKNNDCRTGKFYFPIILIDK